MKIFVQNKKGTLQEECLRDILAEKLAKDLSKNELIMVDVDEHTDNSGSWISIDNDCGNKQIKVLLSFNGKGDTITDVDVYVTPIITKIEEDKTIKLT